VIAGVYLALQTRPIQDAVTSAIAKTLTSAIARHTKAVCRIEKISGNLISGFAITGLSLSDAATGDVILAAENVEISYLLPMLFQKKLWIQQLSVSGLSVTLIKKAGGTWNMDALSPTASFSPPPKQMAPLPPMSEFQMRLGRLDVRHSNVVVSVFDDTDQTIHRFTDINCQARIKLKLGVKNDIFADITHLSVASSLPEINITSLSGDIDYNMNESRFDFKNTAIQGAKSDFTINGSLMILKNAPDRTVLDRIVMNLQANVAAMCLGEFGRAFPIDMPDTDIVSGDLAVKGPVSRMDCRVDLKMDDCHVTSQGIVGIDKNYHVSLDLGGRIGGLDLARLPALPLDFLPGNLNTDGFTLDWRQIGAPDQKGRISLHLTPSVLWDYKIDEANITADINGPDMHFKPLNIRTPYGEMKGGLDLMGIMSGKKDKEIRIASDISGLNPAGLLQDKRYQSDINGNIRTLIRIPATYEAEHITAEAFCRFDSSKIMGVPVQKADMDGLWAERTITIRRFDVETPFGAGAVSGDVDVKNQTLRLQTGADIPDLALARGALPGLQNTRLSGKASMSADIAGLWENPDINAAVKGSEISYNGMTADALSADIQWRGLLTDFSGAVDVGLMKVRMGALAAPSLKLSFDLTPAAVHGDFDLDGGDKTHLTLSGDIRDWMNPDKAIEITEFRLTAFDQPPLVNQGPMTLKLSPDAVSVDVLRLSSGPATLKLTGKAGLTPKGAVAGTLALRDLDISRLSGHLAGADRLRGRISSDVRISGIMEKPVIRMDTSLQNASFDQYAVSEASASIFYSGEKAALKAYIGRNGAKLLEADGFAHASLSLLPFAVTTGPESLDLRVNIDHADISWISDLIDHPEYGFTGKLSVDADIYGDFGMPWIKGNLRLDNGTMNLKKQGLTYETVTTAIRFDKDAITIRDVSISGDKEGRIQLSGFVVHDRLKLQNFNFHAIGKDVYIPVRGGVQAWVNPDLTLSGDRASPKVEGRIRVARCRVNLDRFLQDQPSEIKIVAPVAAENGLMEIPEEEPEGLAVFNPLSADVTVGISKDCWLRGKDTQLEIKGNVQLKKDPEKPFVLFGELNAVRGNYRFRGKLFQITEGSLVFVGQEDLNPPVNIEARTEVDDADIMIRLTGTFQHLNLAFDSDPPMDQAEIVSYILFGRGTEGLSDQETFKAEEMALSFTGQMAADKIKDMVGDTLGIDYLNISAGSSGLQQGSLSMGKYVLPKVFVVFRQGFSEQNSQQFEVSYEINRYFDIQSQIDNEQTSALDLIWKYEF